MGYISQVQQIGQSLAAVPKLFAEQRCLMHSKQVSDRAVQVPESANFGLHAFRTVKCAFLEIRCSFRKGFSVGASQASMASRVKISKILTF